VNFNALIAFIRTLSTSSTEFLSSVNRNIPVKEATFALGSVNRGPMMWIISIRVFREGVTSTIWSRSSEQKRYGSLIDSSMRNRSALSLGKHSQRRNKRLLAAKHTCSENEVDILGKTDGTKNHVFQFFAGDGLRVGHVLNPNLGSFTADAVLIDVHLFGGVR
jgi:hypothetical protein